MRRSAALAFCLAFGCGDDGSATTAEGPATSSAASTTGGAATTTSTSSGAGGDASGGGGAGTGGGAPLLNGFPQAWPNGTDCASEDPIFVWELADDTYILRQSLCTSFEGPFLYLLFGEDKVLLEDTGDGGIPLQTTVKAIIDAYLARHQKTSIELVVAHSHGHGDHVGGDGQLQGQPGTTVVGTNTSAVQQFFGIADWPDEIVTFDLGGRVLDVIPIPGHQGAHVAFYDRRHDLLLTGDTLYPGRLYIQDFPTYVASVGRMVDFVSAGNDVAFVLGTHIEMTTTPGMDFAFGADQHPNEHALELGVDHLLELNAAVQAMGSNPAIEVHDDFIVYPL
jgi:hydroxyacylglutathione hydrolase